MRGRAAQIAASLAGHPVKPIHGKNYLVRCPAHDDQSPSLSICDSEHGLKVHCFSGCWRPEILAAIRAKGLKVDQDDTPSAPPKSSSEYRRQQAEKAGWLWSRRRPIVGSTAERYLREARRYTGPLPPTLAFLPPFKREQHPAMIGAFALVDEPEPGVVGKPQHVSGIHLTLLKPDGSDKAEVNPPKLVVGSPLGRPIVLAPPNELLGLAITEGIEDALTAHAALGLGAWAAGSASFMPAVAAVVPSYIDVVTIFAHADKGGQDGARKLAVALHERGIEVRVEGLS
jgi:hypothetical protein